MRRKSDQYEGAISWRDITTAIGFTGVFLLGLSVHAAYGIVASTLTVVLGWFTINEVFRP